MIEEDYMRLAIQLAMQTKHQTSPNPPVGAVLVKDGMVIGFGAHLVAGEAHAEVIAIDMARENVADATLFVTLEPCSHHGKTPPCTQYIMDHGIARVVVACQDRHDQVAGRGIAMLRDAGIVVDVGLLANEAMPLYDVFFHQITTKMPFVTVKTAMSLDGKTATATLESKWITNETARNDAHQYRHLYDAILVGVNTVLHDNPQLTTRVQSGRNPIRIIMDTHLRTPLEANVMTDGAAPTWMIVGSSVRPDKIAAYEKNPDVRVIQLDTDTIPIKAMLARLYEENITSVYVEGGATINGAFLRERCMDQLILYIAPMIIGGKQAPGPFLGEGFSRLQEALQMDIQDVAMMDGQIKVVATKEESTCLPEL